MDPAAGGMRVIVMRAPASRGGVERPNESKASWPGAARGGSGPAEVCARWCPTLPHPGGCSTIGAVRLSFRVRDGFRAFPCRCDHRDDCTGSASPSRLVRLFGCPSWLPPTTHEHAGCLCVGWSGWVGCGPYSGRSRSYLFHSPPGVGVVVVCVGLLVPVSSQTVAGLPLLAYQPSSLLGAYQKGQVLLVETLS